MNSSGRRRQAVYLSGVFAATLGFAQNAPAANSAAVALNFTGTYLAPTCTVVGAADQTVSLPTVATQSLATAGQTAGATVFSIPIRCEGGVTAARMYFESGSTVDTVTGNLKPQIVAGQNAASNVEVALQDMDGTPIRIGDRTTMRTWTVGATDPTVTSFVASYYATGGSTPGVVQTYVTYVIEVP